jgi:hypothetical protein
VVAPLARPPPPLALTVGLARRDRLTATRGRGTLPFTPVLIPAGQQRPQAFMATLGLYTTPGFLLGQQQQPLYQQAAPTPLLGWNPWVGTGWDQQSLSNSFNTMVLHPPPTSVQDWVADSGATHHTTSAVEAARGGAV